MELYIDQLALLHTTAGWK